MMQISRFKLIDHGRGGIVIEGKESVQIGASYAVVDSIKRERRLMLSEDIMCKINELKYYFYNLTGHWVSPYNNYYDAVNHRMHDIVPDKDGKIKPGHEMLRTLWSRTEITGISYKNGGFVITGEIEAVEGKKVVINTPFIVEDDDIGFFHDAMDKIEECIRIIISFINAKHLPEFDPKKYLSDEEMSDKDVNELSKKVVDKLIDKGLIVLVGSDDHPRLPFTKEDNGITVHADTGNIDSDNIPELEEEETDPPEEYEPSDMSSIEDLRKRDEAIKKEMANQKVDAFGAPAAQVDYPISDGDFRGDENKSGKDLEHAEYSAEQPDQDESTENMKFD